MATLCLVILCFLVTVKDSHASGCKKLHVSGTQHRDDLSGIYKQSSTTCHGRKSYDQLGGENHLFYLNDPAYGQAWHIGPKRCHEEVSAAVFDPALYPEDIAATSIWHEYPGLTVNDTWKPTYAMGVKCYTGFKGCDNVYIENAKHGHSGVYSRQSAWSDDVCYGRYVYKHQTKEYYLYSYFGAWVIGDTKCDRYVYIHSIDNALYPEEVTSSWQISLGYGGEDPEWHSSDIGCICYKTGLSKGAIAGIVIGVLVPIIIVIVVVVVVCLKKKKQVAETSPSNIQHVQTPPNNQQPAPPGGYIMNGGTFPDNMMPYLANPSYHGAMATPPAYETLNIKYVPDQVDHQGDTVKIIPPDNP